MRSILLTLVLGVALITGSCKWFKGNSNKNASAPPKLARWVMQYRSPLSNGLTGNDLSESFYYSSIAVLSPSLVYVGGDMRNPKNREDRVGVIVKTTDSGQSWNETVLEQAGVADIRINGIAFADADTGYVVGRGQGNIAIMFKTTDGGKSWAFTRFGDMKQTPTCIYMADAVTGWMGGTTSLEEDEEEGEPGGPSDLLMTTDGGKTWQSQVRLNVSIYDIQFVDKTTGWASGSKGSIYHTTNGGVTWDKQRTEIETGDVYTLPGSEGAKFFDVSGICFVDAEHGYAAARARNEEETGRIIGTTNGGATWTRQGRVTDSGVHDVFFVNANEGWILTDKGSYIIHTTDGNKTWLSEKKDLEFDPPMSHVAAADAQHVWAVGGGMIIVRQSD
ncbi:MAG TPA: YCF48-related protein [Blastocatellia bacterium]|nr:YCF48-related protein [Blastocatellia bacterium]